MGSLRGILWPYLEFRQIIADMVCQVHYHCRDGGNMDAGGPKGARASLGSSLLAIMGSCATPFPLPQVGSPKP